MTPKKPDRWQRLIDKQNTFQAHNMEVMSVKRVVELLRNEHAWVRRMVNEVNVWACQESMDNEDVIVEILKQLAQRRK